MSGTLEGIRVIDFGHRVAGPLLAVMLADQGAEVVHVDLPGAKGADDPADAFYNRGKRRITLDLKQPHDLDVARRMTWRSDILVENFRPGVMDRLGLGYADLSAASPRLVYCSLPGFARDDPRHKLPAWEGVIDAATGNCRVRAGEAPEGWDPSRPTYSSVPVASNFAAFLGATAVVSALTERDRSGLGQHVEVPLFDAMFEAIGDAGTYVTSRGPSPQRPLTRNGSGTYRCSDGQYVQFNPIGATRRFVHWFLQAAGRTEWAVDIEQEEGLRERLEELFASRPAGHWERLGQEAGVPLARVRTAAEWIATTHALASGGIAGLNDPVLGPTRMAGVPVHVGEDTDTDASAQPLYPRHLPDADRAEILDEVEGLPGPEPSAAPGAEHQRPMAGLRVLDLTQILAGPSAGRILGELGATVVKINVPHRSVGAHGIVNRGKQTILLDVQNPAGQEVFWRLVENSDVVLQNFPPGTAERYGIGYENVRERRPDIVHVSVSCYGSRGPWAQGRGYETQGQAVTGIMARAGGPEGRPAVLGPYNMLDYGSGAMAAFAAALGVYHRTVTGEGRRLRTSLAQTGTHHQAAFMLDYEGKRWTEPTGPDALGEGPLQRFYRASDGWFFLGLAPADLDTLRGVDGLHGLGTAEGEDLAKHLEGRFACRSAAVWVDALQAAGLGAHRVTSLVDLMDGALARGRGLSVTQTSEEVGEVRMPGIAISMSRTPLRLGDAARQPGSDAVRVLERVGLGGTVAELERQGAIQMAALPGGWEHEARRTSHPRHFW